MSKCVESGRAGFVWATRIVESGCAGFVSGAAVSKSVERRRVGLGWAWLDSVGRWDAASMLRPVAWAGVDVSKSTAAGELGNSGNVRAHFGSGVNSIAHGGAGCAIR